MALGAFSGLPAIFYNGKTIELPDPVTSINYTTPGERVVNRSAGPSETLTIRTDVMVDLTSAAFRYDEYDLRRRLGQWWEWAKSGGTWSFARHQDRTINTTLSAAAAADSASLTLTSAAGIDEGQTYILRDDIFVELVKVASVSGNVVTLDETTDLGFSSGATFRDEEFWPGRILGQPPNPFIDSPPVLWDFSLSFVEDRN